MGLFPHVFGQLKHWLISNVNEMIRVAYEVVCLMDFNLLWDRGQQGGVFKQGKYSLFSIFSRLDLFLHVFGQMKEWLILHLYQMTRVPYVVACPIVFILFHDRNWQERVFKAMKNDHFLVFLVVWVLFHMFLGRSKSELYQNCMKR